MHTAFLCRRKCCKNLAKLPYKLTPPPPANLEKSEFLTYEPKLKVKVKVKIPPPPRSENVISGLRNQSRKVQVNSPQAPKIVKIW